MRIVTPTFPKPWLLAIGILLAFVPTYGSFVAVILLFTQRWTLERRDLLWAGAGTLLALPALAGGRWIDAFQAFGAVAAAWIVFRAFRLFKNQDLPRKQQEYVGIGLLAGFTGAVTIGLIRQIDIDTSTALSVVDAISWAASPALFGHSVLVMGGLIALVARGHRRIASAAMAIAALGILISGSREAAIAWVVLAILQIIVRDADARRPRGAETLALAVMMIAASGLAPFLGWGRIGFGISPEAIPEARNLLTGTEVLGDWWDERWVDVTASETIVAGQPMTAYAVQKRERDGWLRLQQLVQLAPGTTYTISGWIEEDDEAVPGIHGWAQLPGGGGTVVLTSTLRDGTWRGSFAGPGALLSAEEIDRDGRWHRVALTFRYEADKGPATWFVGFVPDTRRSVGETTRVAGLQLEAGNEATPYTAAPAIGGTSFQVARAPLWELAWKAILDKPLFGWGEGNFSDVYLEERPTYDRLQIAPAHAHNLFLQILFEKGLLGLSGLFLLLVALFGLGVRYRDLGLLSLAVAVLIANSFDNTLFHGGVLYPLAAVAGWRSARRGARRSDGAETARQIGVRLTLALSDIGATLTTFLLIHQVVYQSNTTSALAGFTPYAFLLWPALSWVHGLYPGYGLTPAQELRKQVTASTTAGLVFVGGLVVLPGFVPASPLFAVAFVISTLVALPIARATTKRLLHAMRLWGRPVLILGAGATGRLVLRVLTRTPLDGLHPMAVFDDDPTVRATHVYGVRVRGGLDDAYAFARRHHVQHAIVAIPSLDPGRLDRLVNASGRAFRTVQFVPRLHGIPTEDVLASDLAGMLALEVRNGLFSASNRLAKRVTDLLGATVLLLLASPLFVVLWTLVRLDSAGPAFYRSERVGQNDGRFRCLKFRTMHVDAEERLQRMMDEDPRVREEYARWHKLEDDPRITRVGRFLRRTSLDELPQLWNVVRGEMSLVGPRPYLARELPEMGASASIVLQAKPGITGHWQVTGRSTVTFAERLAMEAHYVRNWSIWWDVILLMHTPRAVVRDRDRAK